MSKAVKSIGKAVSGVGKALGGAVKSIGNAIGGVVKKAAPVLAPIAMVAFPGFGTAIGASLRLSGTAATLAGGGLLGAAGSALAGRNPLEGALLGGGGAYLGSMFGGAQGLLGSGAPVGGSTGLKFGTAGAQGIYNAAPAVSGYNLAASSIPATAGSIGGLGSGLVPTSAMSLTAPAANAIGGMTALRGLGLAQGLLGQQQQPQQMEYQRPTMLTGAPNFEPILSLLTKYRML